MLTFYHSPQSRSTTIALALAEMGINDRVETQTVTVPRVDGTGAVDPKNPHPEGKVPALVHDGHLIWERPAILSFLSELFPEATAICPPGHAERGPFLSWLACYGDVVEPVMILSAAEIEHPFFTASIRGPKEVFERIEGALADGRPYLLASGFTVADLLMASPFAFFPDAVPDIPAVRQWVDRVLTRPHYTRVTEEEATRSAA